MKVGLGLRGSVVDWGVAIYRLVLTGFGNIGGRWVVLEWVCGLGGGEGGILSGATLLTAEAGGAGNLRVGDGGGGC